MPGRAPMRFALPRLGSSLNPVIRSRCKCRRGMLTAALARASELRVIRVATSWASALLWSASSARPSSPPSPLDKVCVPRSSLESCCGRDAFTSCERQPAARSRDAQVWLHRDRHFEPCHARCRHSVALRIDAELVTSSASRPWAAISQSAMRTDTAMMIACRSSSLALLSQTT